MAIDLINKKIIKELNVNKIKEIKLALLKNL